MTQDWNCHLTVIDNDDLSDVEVTIVADGENVNSVLKAAAKAIADVWGCVDCDIVGTHIMVHTGKLCGDVEYKLNTITPRTGGPCVIKFA
jgi:hypothetical protein